MAKRKANPEDKHRRMVAMIMEVFEANAGKAFNYKEITEKIGLKSKGDRLEVQDLLFDMASCGMIKECTAGKYKVTASGESSHIIGVVDMTASGSAYIIPENKEEGDEDIFVSQSNLNRALHGDKVEVLVYAHRKGHRPEGEVVSIIKHMREQYVGIIDIHNGVAFLVTDQKQTGGHDIYIPIEHLNGAKDGQKAIAVIKDWPTYARNPIGSIIEVLGEAGNNQTEMHAILAEFGLPHDYPQDVADEAAHIEPGITPEEISKRLDMRDVTTFTIDPVDAKDFDDAVSLRKLKNGNWEVGVHIADVTHYIQPDSSIEKEGYKRATSVYLVDRVVPMLPEHLCNYICSLRPDEEKLTFSVVFEMNDSAEIIKSKIAKSVIKSNRRFTYEEAQEIIEGSDGDYKNEILKLNELAQILRKRRFEHGAIGFERAEVRFKIDENGKPISVYFKEAKEANMLIEEFMLLANKRVAEFIGKDELNGTARKRTPKTFVYRVHDQPNEDKYNKFATFVRRFGYEASPQKGEEIYNAVNRILAEVKGKSEQNLVEVLAVRTMAKAIYTTHNIGHYGLAFEYYTHFTSPIRRYPDMMVHRLLYSYLNGGRSVSAQKYEDMCEHCSEQEVMAAEAERASIKYKQVEFLMDRIGEEFDATISGVTEWGIYCEINENKCEGMVPLRDLENDNYYFDEDNYCVIGRNTGKKFQLGDPIRIRIANANLERKQLDFTIAGSALKSIEIQNQKIKEAKEKGLEIPKEISAKEKKARIKALRSGTSPQLTKEKISKKKEKKKKKSKKR